MPHSDVLSCTDREIRVHILYVLDGEQDGLHHTHIVCHIQSLFSFADFLTSISISKISK